MVYLLFFKKKIEDNKTIFCLFMKCTWPVRAHLTVKLLLKAMLLLYEFELLISLEVLDGGCTQTH